MTPDLHAAAARVRRIESGESYHGVYGDRPCPDETYWHQFNQDRYRLADAYLSLFDGTPSIECEEYSYELPRVMGLQTRVERSEQGRWLIKQTRSEAACLSDADADADEIDTIALPITTLGQLRLLLAALQPQRNE